MLGTSVVELGTSVVESGEWRLLLPEAGRSASFVVEGGLDPKAQVGDVKVYDLGVTAESVPQTSNALDQRCVGPYLARPHSAKGEDPDNARTTAPTLRAYLHLQGFNSLLLGVVAESGHDSAEDDLLHHLLALFDGDNLTLVPEIQFTTTLASLEPMGSAEPAACRLVHADGRTWRDAHPGEDNPGYNPLDPRVQDSLAARVAEYVELFRSHRSVRAVALQLGGTGALTLPGAEWGYDDATIARFQQATLTPLPTFTGADAHRRRSQYLLNQVRPEWLRWRAAELARFHLRLVKIITDGLPEATVLFTTHLLLPERSQMASLSPQWRTGQGADAWWLEHGLDFALYRENPRIVVLRPTRYHVPTDLWDVAWDDTLNHSPAIDQLVAHSAAPAGSLSYHEPLWIPASGSHQLGSPPYEGGVRGGPSADSPAGANESHEPAIPAQLSPIGPENRRRIAHALAALDAQFVFDGGAAIPLGQEHTTRELRQLLRALPAVHFEMLSTARQPVVVRIARHEGSTYLYAVNDSAYESELTLHLNCPAETSIEWLGETTATRKQADASGVRLALVLPAWQAAACRVAASSLEAAVESTKLPAAAVASLRGRIEEFETRLDALSHAQRRRVLLPNPGFEQEQTDRRGLPGWEFPPSGAGHWVLDRRGPYAGQAALRLSGRNPGAVVLTPVLSLADSRDITMRLWLRSNKPAFPVRLAFQWESAAKVHVQPADVSVGTEWQQFQFRVRSLPQVGVRQPRLTVEMLQEGKLWLDDVEIELDPWTTDDVKSLTKHLSAVRLAFDERRFADCQRLLESYWGQMLFAEPTANPTSEGAATATRTARGVLRR